MRRSYNRRSRRVVGLRKGFKKRRRLAVPRRSRASGAARSRVRRPYRRVYSKPSSSRFRHSANRRVTLRKPRTRVSRAGSLKVCERTTLHKGSPSSLVMSNRGFTPAQNPWCVWLSGYYVNIIPKSLNQGYIHHRRTDMVRCSGVNVDLAVRLTGNSRWMFRVLVVQTPSDLQGHSLVRPAQFLPPGLDPPMNGFFDAHSECMYTWSESNAQPVVKKAAVDNFTLGDRLVTHRNDYELWNSARTTFPWSHTFINRRFMVTNSGKDVKEFRLNAMRSGMHTTWRYGNPTHTRRHEGQLRHGQLTEHSDTPVVEEPDRKMVVYIIGRLIKPYGQYRVPEPYDPTSSYDTDAVKVFDDLEGDYDDDGNLREGLSHYRTHGFGPPPLNQAGEDIDEPDLRELERGFRPGVHNGAGSTDYITVRASEAVFAPYRQPTRVLSRQSSAPPDRRPNAVTYPSLGAIPEYDDDGNPVIAAPADGENPPPQDHDMHDAQEQQEVRRGARQSRVLRAAIDRFHQAVVENQGEAAEDTRAIVNDIGGRGPADRVPEVIEDKLGPEHSTAYITPTIRLWFRDMYTKSRNRVLY